MEVENVNVFNEPYKATIEDKALGVHISVTAKADDDTDAGRAEADRRARLIVEHFKMMIGKT